MAISDRYTRPHSQMPSLADSMPRAPLGPLMLWQSAGILLLAAALLIAGLLASAPAKADSHLMAAARKGDAEAAEHLALLYETGSGLRRNEAEAAYWYGRAAQAGRRQSQYAYAQFLENGTGISKDEKSALHWYLAAASQGHTGAAVNIAAMLATGRGTTVDRLSGYRLLLWAKAQRGQESRQPQVDAALEAVGAGLRASDRKAATPLEPRELQARLGTPKSVAQK
ncbi:MAG: tetratricopeptide repeat protein [Ferrovibrio sp.]|uniref:tetratricopeptide repeat protein n=1 Tax=Ferrovibrio sp. TaxID=1917215 RepID=UPI003919669D